MDFLTTPFTEMQLFAWEQVVNDWVFLLALVLLALELLRYAFLGKLSWNLLGDTATNFATFAMYLAVSYVVFAALYLGAFFTAQQFALFEIESSLLTLLLCIVLADLAYYWEHRFSHRVGLAWATHSVHHSSTHFNLSVANRFGPLDDLWAILFHLPLVLIGFDPVLVFFAALLVLQYQTFLHTEAVGKLPRPIEWLFNTPSHHRVHHGANPQYLDKNYGGLFIVWDRLFGSFAEEQETVRYGLVRPIGSLNPLVVFGHGLYRLAKSVATTAGLADKLRRLVLPPDWEPEGKRTWDRKRTSPS